MNGAADIVEFRLPHAIKIPAKALFTNHGKAVVYEKTNDGYRERCVQVRARNTDEVAIEGVPAGATVALANPQEQTGAA